MTFIWGLKKPNGTVHYYLRKTERVNGKPKVTMNIYLGTADKILDIINANKNIPEGFDLISFQFGTVASISMVNEEIGFTRIVEEVTGSSKTANALLAYICGRSEEPLSKNGMGRWSERSALPLLMSDIPSLSTRSYIRHMDKLTPEDIEQISFRIAERLIEMGHKPSIIFFDTTNFSTEQQPHGELDRALPTAGNARDGNRQAKLVGLATATTDRYIPIIHEVYPGKENDAKYFQHSVSSMMNTLTKLGMKCEELCFVFDRGMNSKEGWEAMTSSEVHFISSLKRNQAVKLLDKTLSEYRETYRTKSGEVIYTIREDKIVMGVNGVAVVAYNVSGEKKQNIDYENAKRRFIKGCEEIARSMNANRRGRPSSIESINRRVIALIPEKWRILFRYHAGNTIESSAAGDNGVKLTYWIDKEAEKEKRSGFGKTVIFTDRKDWSNERIVRTYFARSGMEEDYHILKDVHLFPVMPIYHRIDKRIRAHTFMCVMGLLFYRYIQWKIEEVRGESMPMGRMVSILKQIRLGGLIINDNDVRFKLERMGVEEKEIVKILKIDSLVPN